MDVNLSSVLDRADQFGSELSAEYDSCLRSRSLSPALQQLTHDVAEKLSSALDRAAFRYWDKNIRPSLPIEIAKKTARNIYFPTPTQQEDLQAQLGRWRISDAGVDPRAIMEFFSAFVDPSHQWVRDIRIVANEGKHVGLTPQRYFRNERVFAERGGAQVSWDPNGVKFGAGVLIAGVPVDPRTQMPMTAPDMSIRHEVYTGFVIESINRELLEFVKVALPNARVVVSKMAQKFRL